MHFKNSVSNSAVQTVAEAPFLTAKPSGVTCTLPWAMEDFLGTI